MKQVGVIEGLYLFTSSGAQTELEDGVQFAKIVGKDPEFRQVAVVPPFLTSVQDLAKHCTQATLTNSDGELKFVSMRSKKSLLICLVTRQPCFPFGTQILTSLSSAPFEFYVWLLAFFNQRNEEMHTRLCDIALFRVGLKPKVSQFFCPNLNFDCLRIFTAK